MGYAVLAFCPSKIAQKEKAQKILLCSILNFPHTGGGIYICVCVCVCIYVCIYIPVADLCQCVAVANTTS